MGFLVSLVVGRVISSRREWLLPPIPGGGWWLLLSCVMGRDVTRACSHNAATSCGERVEGMASGGDGGGDERRRAGRMI